MNNIAVSIIEFVILFGLLAFLHESGHFIVARLFKIEVEEFGFGFPPRLLRLGKIGQTEFTLNWIPFGAFVRPKGENNPEIPGGLAAAPPIARISTMLGGPVVNILIGILILSFVFQSIGVPDPVTVKIQAISPDSPAAQAGMLPGDVITRMNSEPILNTDQFLKFVAANLGKEIALTYVHNGAPVDVRLTPRVSPPSGQGAIGIERTTVPLPYGQALADSFGETGVFIKQIILLPYNLIQGTISTQQARVVGPVGMYSMFDKVRQTDIQNTANYNENLPLNTMYLIAIISIALGFTNLLPIPALDGGRILLTLPELIIHRRVPADYENLIHLIGFVALLMLMFYVTAQDIFNPVVLP